MADTENTSPAPAESTEGTKPAESTEGTEGAPWGDDFDAERAWKLVQNLRKEKDELKVDRDRIKDELQASKSSTDPDKLTAAETRAKEAERALYLERVYRAHPELDADDFRDFLTGDTEEEITAKAERLARLGKPKEGTEEGTEGDPAPAGSGAAGGDTTPPPGKPTPSLVPGHGGEEAPAFDPVAIARAARR